LHHRVRGQLLAVLLVGVQVDVVHNDIGTQPGKMQRIGPPQPPGAARDQRDLARELACRIIHGFCSFQPPPGMCITNATAGIIAQGRCIVMR